MVFVVMSGGEGVFEITMMYALMLGVTSMTYFSLLYYYIGGSDRVRRYWLLCNPFLYGITYLLGNIAVLVYYILVFDQFKLFVKILIPIAMLLNALGQANGLRTFASIYRHVAAKLDAQEKEMPDISMTLTESGGSFSELKADSVDTASDRA
jgi:hypothetical protein